MDSLKLSFEAIAPIFLLMLLGYVLKCMKVADKKNFDVINKLVFKVFLPVLLFYNIYKTESLEVFDLKLMIFTIVVVLCIFIMGYIFVNLYTKENPKKGVMLQGFYRSNFAIFGVPLVGYICGDAVTGLASMMVAIVVPMFNVLAVLCLERFRDGNLNVLKLLKGIVTNPLIIGCVIGAIFLGFGVKLPKVIEKSVRDISGIATPLAIIVLGASFTFSSIKGYLKDILIVLSARLIIVPLIGVTLGVLAGFRGEALACLLVIFGSPVAVSSFAMSQQMGGDEKLAAQDVVMTSAFCLITLFGWIFVLNYLNLF